jgi:hypothetical protein
MPMYYINDEQIETLKIFVKRELDMERSKPKNDKDYARIGYLRLLSKFLTYPSEIYKVDRKTGNYIRQK